MDTNSSWMSKAIFKGSYLKNKDILAIMAMVLLGLPLMLKVRNLEISIAPLLVGTCAILILAISIDWWMRKRLPEQYEQLTTESTGQIASPNQVFINICLVVVAFLLLMSTGLLFAYLLMIFAPICNLLLGMFPKLYHRWLIILNPTLAKIYLESSSDFKTDYSLWLVTRDMYMLVFVIYIIILNWGDFLPVENLWTMSWQYYLGSLITVIIGVFGWRKIHSIELRSVQNNVIFEEIKQSYSKKASVLMLLCYGSILVIILAISGWCPT